MVDKHSQLYKLYYNTIDVFDVAIDETGMIKREQSMSSTYNVSELDRSN